MRFLLSWFSGFTARKKHRKYQHINKMLELFCQPCQIQWHNFSRRWVKLF
ncbi:hypothetical protein M23134_08284 [Microscilla marina ATCC 23134]|uniref:Uncharacterized protein n=1 Tax=Microscilla marina ATCC 23134 TaxID=313606 RepID=A1ZQG0_MICM2|nr:hypothetical protein M23134_08284 [Microscilla marina ATCC 23134]